MDAVFLLAIIVLYLILVVFAYACKRLGEGR